jgi:hypothetical protein
MVVRMPVVVVEPQLVPIVFDVEHVEIAVAVSFVWSTVCTTTLRMLKWVVSYPRSKIA